LPALGWVGMGILFAGLVALTTGLSGEPQDSAKASSPSPSPAGGRGVDTLNRSTPTNAGPHKPHLVP
jgi:hypothetical protein